MDRPYILLSDGDNDPLPTAFMPVPPTQEALTQVNKLHMQLRERLRRQVEGIEGILVQILNIKCTIDQKCMNLDVKKIIRDNAQVIDGLQSLQKCFGILCKYAQNLLVHPDRRPPNWKNVNFNNETFVQCVAFMQGSEDVLGNLGYTVSTQEGLEFPRNSEPDTERIAAVTADLKIFHAEMSYYNMGNHPNPIYFEAVIPQYWCRKKGQPYLVGQSQSISPEQQYPHGQCHTPGQVQQSPVQGEQYPQGQVSGLYSPYSPVQGQQYPQGQVQGLYSPYSPVQRQQYPQIQGQPFPQVQGLGQQYPQSQGQQFPQGQGLGQQYPQSQGQQFPQVQGLGQQYPQSQGQGLKYSKIGGHHTGQGDQEEDEFHDAHENLTTDYQEQDCDICGSEKAATKCPECDGKQLCQSCDNTWHSHPRRISHDCLFLHSSGTWISHSSTGAKPKVPPDKPLQGLGDPGTRETNKVPYSVTPNFPRPFQVHAQKDNGSENVPNLSIFNEKRPFPPANLLGSSVIPTMREEKPLISFEDNLSSSSEYNQEGASPGVSDSQSRTTLRQKGKILVNEIKAMPNKEDQISRIKQELGQLDIRLSQCEQELHVIFRDDDFEDKSEYTRLSKQRDHLSRNQLLLNEYWKELEREKHESKTAKSNTNNVGNPQTGSPVDIRYPPLSNYQLRTTAFDFQRDVAFPHAKPPVQQQDVRSQMSDVGKLDHERVAREPIAWVCNHCTYHNDTSSKNCSVCQGVSDQPSLVYDDRMVHQNHTVLREEDNEQYTENHGIPIEPNLQTPSGKDETGIYKSVFVEMQDNILKEKEEAREKYRRMIEKESRGQGHSTEEAVEEVMVKRPPKSGSLGNLSDKNSLDAGIRLGNFDPIIHSQLKLDLSRVQDIATYPGPLPNVVKKGGLKEPPQVKPKTTGIKQDLTPPENEYMDMQSKLELIQKMKEQEEDAIQSRELIRTLRKAETEGYSIKEMEIAIEQSEFPDPFYWIECVWQDQIKSVVGKVSELLAADNSSWGSLSLVSEAEARKALQDCDGQVDEAVESLKQNWESALNDLFSLGEYTAEQVLKALQDNQCDKEATEQALLGEFFKVFEQKIWNEEGGEDGMPVDSLDIVLEQKLRDTHLEEERRIRMVLCEYERDVKSWGRAGNVVRLLEEVPDDVTIMEVIEAVRQCGNREQAYSYLQQECTICYGSFPASKILSLTLCQCKVCRECMQEYFEVQIKERHIKNLCCPTCEMPEDVESEEAILHLQFLHNFLKNLVSLEVFQIYEDKVRDWQLMKDPNFRWCSWHTCENGFIFNPEGNRLKMRCDRCHKFTCFRCKKPWAEQHENVSCERYKAWQEANNPEFQEAGLARHLQENGIDCPKCKMRYSLAKGGCMHFKCTQCGHEFCCGCNMPFLHRGACKEMASCELQGLHCHHPRDCLYYLRDSDVEKLQELLEDNDVEFRSDNPEQGNGKCLVMEQKETQAGLQDEACGRDVAANQSGLCVIHYKEYLVSQINTYSIDPVTHMNLDDIQTLFRRKDHEVPQKQQNESDTQYKQRLINEVKLKFKLERRIQVL